MLANNHEKDPEVKQACIQNVMMIQQRYSNLLPLLAKINHTRLLAFLTKQYHFARALDLVRIGQIVVIIFEWPCQGLSQVSTSQGLSNPMSGLF